MTTETATRIYGTTGWWQYNGVKIHHLETIQSKYKWWVTMTPKTYKFKTQKEAVRFIQLRTGK